MKVNIFDLKFDNLYIKLYQSGCKEILESGLIAESKYTRLFEENFSKLIKCKHSVAVTSGTAALEIALKAINVEGKDVIIPSNTFFATAIAVRNSGGNLKLVDIENETFSIDPENLKKSITKNTKAVILVHIGGIISKYIKEIVEICKENDIFLIEDAAHAHCSTREEYKAGSIGDIGCFSFFPTKVMTTGEGGMITTNDDVLFDKIKSLKNFGRHNENIGICVNDFGNNFKVSEFTSLLGCLEVGRVKYRINRRKELAKIYYDKLKDIYEVCYDEDISNSFYKIIIKIKGCQEKYHLLCKNKGVSLTGEVYKISVHEQPLFKDKFDSNFPVTNYFSKHHICPPLYPELTNEQVEYVCNILQEIYEDKSC